MRPFFFFPFPKCVSRQTQRLVAGCVRVFVRVCGVEFACMKRALGVNGVVLSNSLFLDFYRKCQLTTAGGRQSICSCITPLIPFMRECVKHPDLSCRYQNRVLIIYTLCTVSFYPPTPQSWSLYSFITTNSPSKQFISLHIKIPYLHDDSPRRQKCNVLYVMSFTRWLC